MEEKEEGPPPPITTSVPRSGGKTKFASKILTEALKTDEVESICRMALRGTDAKFLGVGAAHSLPTIDLLEGLKHKPCCFVANTQTKEKTGEHWVAFFFPAAQEKRKPFLFDSFARSTSQMGHPDWDEYMKSAAYRRNGAPGKWKRQRFVVQDDKSSVCGVLCAWFLWNSVRDYNPFPNSAIVPRQKLKAFINHLADPNQTNK